MPDCIATVVVPTLLAGAALTECLDALLKQTQSNFEVIVVDNSGKRLVGEAAYPGVRVLEMDGNVGFGAAINAAWKASRSPYLATLNDDARACAGWLAALIHAIERDPEVGSCASQVRFMGEDLLDSAGMLICADGSSKQRGHARETAPFSSCAEVLMPSASAALYRRAMLDEVSLDAAGPFDGSFFLYCEDTDVGLRAARMGWRCLYVPEAVVEHRYSHSAGRVSELKAYYVERNRISVAIKNFPLRMLLAVPTVSLRRYWWHLLSTFHGHGAAARFQQQGGAGWRLLQIVVQAHLSPFSRLTRLRRERREIARRSRLSEGAFEALLRRFAISPREVAEL